MHELSLCEGIVDIIQNEAQTQGFDRVKSVWLEIGQLAAVDEQAMRFSYDVVVKNTIAEASILHIEILPGLAWCLSCAKSVSVTARFDACPDCGNYQIQVTQGDEMRIKELEVV
ncbi:MAG: hydrogenase maturation nickel metallochaperone HypA [Gammaproteobacteria bacterium]|nr:hydrogenase maturation nickel metallochaperone HypA [Gammaproteobacteria bacterium]